MLMNMWSVARSLWVEPPARGASAGIRWYDGVLAAAVAVAAGLEAIVGPGPVWLIMLMGLAVTVAVLIRRAHCLAAVVLAFGMFVLVDLGTVVSGADPVALSSGVAVLVVVYALFRWAAGRDVLLGAGVIMIELLLSILTDFSGPADAIGGAAVLVSAAAVGAARRYRVLVRGQLIEQTRLQEREQLARDLHDTVAHHVSAMAIQAQAGLVLARSASASGALEALEVIEREAATTLQEMRAMVGSLRGTGDRSPAVSGGQLADLQNLACRGPGLPRVEVRLRGDLTGLPAGVQAGLYRVAQEAVTNAKRHARRATLIDVTVVACSAEVRLGVVDDGAATTGGVPGYGLIGMAERVQLLGGTFHAGPGAEHGWLVTAVLPRPGAAS